MTNLANPEIARSEGAPVMDPAAEHRDSGATRHDSPVRTSLIKSAPWLVLLAICFADVYQRTDPDIWGHIRFGQLVLSFHRAILHDTFSYTAFGREFRNHEWLTDVTMALIYNHVGILGLKLWKFAFVAGTILFLAAAMADTDASIAVQLIVLLTAAAALDPQEQFRPQLYTFFFFASTIALLVRHNYRGSAPLYLMLPIMAVWCNVHGGFVVGLGTLGIYTGVVGLQDLTAGRGLKRAWPLALYTLAATMVTLLTPFGIGNWYTVLKAVFSPYIRSIIVDWRPLIAAMMEQLGSKAPLGALLYIVVIGLIAALAVSFYFTPRGGDFPLVVIAALMSVAAFNAQRNMALAVIACTPVVARHASLCFERLRERNKVGPPLYTTEPERFQRIQRFMGVLAIVVALAGGLFSPWLQTDMGYPAGAVAFMKTHGLHGNILDDFGWGEYLIWHDPQSKVFIDGRYGTLYPNKVMNDYLAFYFDRPGAKKVLASYPNNFVLIPPQSPAFALMKHATGWMLVYRDKDSVLFARAGSAATRVAGIPIRGVVPKKSYFP